VREARERKERGKREGQGRDERGNREAGSLSLAATVQERGEREASERGE